MLLGLRRHPGLHGKPNAISFRQGSRNTGVIEETSCHLCFDRRSRILAIREREEGSDKTDTDDRFPRNSQTRTRRFLFEIRNYAALSVAKHRTLSNEKLQGDSIVATVPMHFARDGRSVFEFRHRRARRARSSRSP